MKYSLNRSCKLLSPAFNLRFNIFIYFLFFIFQVVALALILVLSASGLPLNGNNRELDSAVEGVQKYLESSGFPKMTRGEILDFLSDFSRNARISRSDKTVMVVTPPPEVAAPKKTPVVRAHEDEPKGTTTSRTKIPKADSPLNYGYPLSMSKRTEKSLSVSSTTPTIFVTLEDDDISKQNEMLLRAINGRNGSKKTVMPSVDLNAYAKFKKIPEARNLKIDDDMKELFGKFGLMDVPQKSGKSIGSKGPQRRNDNVPATEPKTKTTTTTTAATVDDDKRRRSDSVPAAAETTVDDDKLLESVLVETGYSRVNQVQGKPIASSSPTPTATRGHVFNPTGSHIKTIDVNRIAKIVENIRLLTDDNNTLSLPQEVIQKKLENITSAIANIDEQPADAAKEFNGYEVFFDDNSKEVDSELPDAPTGTEPLNKAHNPPDPLSTDELQQLVEKNKSEVKRQQPAQETSDDDDTTTTTTSTTGGPTTGAGSEATSEATSATSTDSSSEATSPEVTSDGDSAARDASTTAASDTNPSLSQLAESFGGGETASDPPMTDDSSTDTTSSNRPKNGLYFYVDWNSFLTVNEGQKNQVNLRFAPRAGNPAHFLRVNVP